MAIASIALVIGVLLNLFSDPRGNDRAGGRRNRTGKTLAAHADSAETDAPGSKSGPGAPSTRDRTLPAGPRFDVHGVVQTRKGAPVPGARLIVAPAAPTYSGTLPPGYRREATSDADGMFRLSFDGFFGAELAITAHSTEGIGYASATAVQQTPIVVTVKPVAYERLEFVDESGAAVAVRGWQGLEGLGTPDRIVWGPSSERSPLERRRAEFSQLTGLDLACASNEWFCIGNYRDIFELGGANGEAKRLSPGPRAICIPGYESVTVNLAGRPLSEWPQSRKVTLKRDPSKGDPTFYRLKLPTAPIPESWDADRQHRTLGVYVHASRSRRTSSALPPPVGIGHADPSSPELFVLTEPELHFYADLPGTGFRINTFAIECDVVRVDHLNAEVRPRYPDIAWLELALPAAHPESETFFAGNPSLLFGETDVAGRTDDNPVGGFWFVGPGRFRCGPLYVGRYRLKFHWYLRAGSSPVTAVPDAWEFDIDIEKGLNLLRVKDEHSAERAE